MIVYTEFLPLGRTAAAEGHSWNEGYWLSVPKCRWEASDTKRDILLSLESRSGFPEEVLPIDPKEGQGFTQ